MLALTSCSGELHCFTAVRDDILSIFLSFLSPGIAITILHIAAPCGSSQFIFKVSPKTCLVRVFAQLLLKICILKF